MHRQIVLASQSPRRRELMLMCKLPFVDVNPGVDEIIDETLPLNEAIMNIAMIKAQAVFQRFPEAVVVGADTIVVLDYEIMQKPVDEDDAIRMLRKLSGRKHRVITGVAIISAEEKVVFYDETSVEFFNLSDEEIITYVKSKEPMDKAGAYGIHALGALLVKSINGDYYSVVGLPIARVYKILRKYV